MVAEVSKLIQYMGTLPKKDGKVAFFGACWAFPHVRVGYLADIDGIRVEECWPAPPDAKETFGIGEALLALCQASGELKVSVFVSTNGEDTIVKFGWRVNEYYNGGIYGLDRETFVHRGYVSDEMILSRVPGVVEETEAIKVVREMIVDKKTRRY